MAEREPPDRFERYLDRLSKANEHMEEPESADLIRSLQAEITAVQSQLAASDKRVEELGAVVGWYGDEDNFVLRLDDTDCLTSPATQDKGQRARQALEVG